jgi:hypothetical protein
MAAHAGVVTAVLRRERAVLGRVVIGQTALDVFELG